jgi:sigma-B regulation protein RsbU (phosphoserine phosphatase)
MSATIKLTVNDPAGKSREVIVEKFPYTIGRLGDNDLLLRDNRISRKQATIVEEDNQFFLEDADSRHGTFVNGDKITRHRLQPNDRIEFGVAESFVLIFSSDQPDVGKLLDRFRASSSDASSVGELQQLNSMLEVSRVLHAGLALDDILTQVVDSCLQIAQAERGLLLLKDESGKLEFRVARDRARSTLSGKNLRISKTVVDRAMETRRHVIHMDAAGEAGATLGAVGNSIADLELRTLICLPLMRMQVTTASETTSFGSSADVIGVLYMDSKRPTSSFSDTSREILQTLCLEASTVVENAKLLALSREKDKIEQELKIARTIQQKLLPRKYPEGLKFDVSGQNVACQQVGGDYYDFFELPRGRLGIVIADVSGKGTAAALLASMLQGVFWATATADNPPAWVASRVNHYVCERSTPDKYATLFYGIFDPAGTITYVNAGHNPPMLVKSGGQVVPLSSENLPIGMFADAAYKESIMEIACGETIVMYTDGVTEAANNEDEMYGEERLAEFLVPANGQDLEQVRDRLLQAVKSFAGGEPQNDDITVVAARRM